MSEIRSLLTKTAHQVFGQETDIEDAIAAAGLRELPTQDGVDLGDIAAVVRVAAYHASNFGEHLMPPVGNDPDRRALLRAVQISGALDRVLDLTVEYSIERHQFGQPLHRFQAVQAHLVTLAGLAALTRAAVDAAVVNPTSQRVAIAKVLAGRASTDGAVAAHQVHGAIGLTREYKLRRFTTLLWRWRDQDGTEADWSEQLGCSLAQQYGSFWEKVTTG